MPCSVTQPRSLITFCATHPFHGQELCSQALPCQLGGSKGPDLAIARMGDMLRLRAKRLIDSSTVWWFCGTANLPTAGPLPLRLFLAYAGYNSGEETTFV